MRCFSCALAAIVVHLATTVAAEERGIDSILQHTRGVIENAAEIVGDEMRSTLEAPVQSEEVDWIQGPAFPAGDDNHPHDDSAQARSWRAIEAGGAEVHQEASISPPHPEVPEDVMYVYISLSMPAATIRSLFLEALDRQDELVSVFVLRGWDVPGPDRLVGRLNRLFPDAEELGELPNVQINPVLYRQQDVGLVPTYSKKNDSGSWVQLTGVTTLHDAAERLERGQDSGAVIGPTYSIEEPDILELIETRAAMIDWESEVARVRQGIMTQRTTGRELAYAIRDQSYLVDLTIVNNEDLAGPEGDVFAAAGQSVNPLDYMTMSRKYVFIDANSEYQVARAMQWKTEHERITVISTIPVANIEARQRLMSRLGQQVYEINDLLIRRFQLREVPAIAYQEDRMLRVDVVATNPSSATEARAHE